MSVSARIDVRHERGSYPVVIAPGSVAMLDAAVEEAVPGRRLAVITDRTVARAVPQPLKVPVLVVPPGEGSKSRRRWADLTDQLLDLGLGRDSALVALGGGVVGDLAGFVAATFLRGVPCLQVPTSLLAMVDSSVGGKTGLNTHHGKNLVGAFHPPVMVVVDPLVLATLDPTHVRGGLIEALKHGLIQDAGYYRWIGERAAGLLAGDPDLMTDLVRQSVEIKAAIVSADEREAGRRAILNAGHTAAHALERWSEYQLPHGDAVGLGLVVEAVLSEQLGRAPDGLAEDLARRLAALGLAVPLPPASDDQRVVEAMRHDKKAVEGAIRFALPGEPGELGRREAGWTVAASEDDVRQALGRTREILAD